MNAWQILEEERVDLADALEELTPEQWDTPSLCSEWTVAEVATHLTVGPTTSTLQFLRTMALARGRFPEANKLLVARRMNRPRGHIVADLREYADSRWTPPMLDWHAPLTDFLVHRLDITIPLEIEVLGDPEAWAPALEFLVSRAGQRAVLDKKLPALTYVADDIEWVAESVGPEVHGTAEDLALAITRRPVRLDEITGPGADTLRAWARSG